MIKTTAQIVREAMKDDNGTPDTLTLEDENKRWADFDKLSESIEKLKVETYDLYHKLGKVEVWKASNDEVCDMCEEFVHKKINEIFSDIIKKVTED